MASTQGINVTGTQFSANQGAPFAERSLIAQSPAFVWCVNWGAGLRPKKLGICLYRASRYGSSNARKSCSLRAAWHHAWVLGSSAMRSMYAVATDPSATP